MAKPTQTENLPLELPTDPPVRDVSISDLDDPNSIVNLVPLKFKEAILRALKEKPQFFELDERSLYRAIKEDLGLVPTPLDNRLRLKFWDEYDRAQSRADGVMNMTNVVSGLVSREMFQGYYLTHPAKVAWLLCPPTGYHIKMAESLEFGIEQLRDILAEDHTMKNGRINTQLVSIKLKIVMMLDARVRGAIVQKNLQVHMNARNDISAMATENTIDDLAKQLTILRRREANSRNIPEGVPPGESTKPDIEVS